MRALALAALCSLLACLAAPARAQTTVFADSFNNLNNWTEYTPSSDYGDWTTASSGSNPSCSPQESGSMARFYSTQGYSGDESRIVKGGLNLTGAEVAEARFWVYRSSSYSSSYKLRFQYSLDGNRYFTLRDIRPNAGTGWVEEVVPLGFWTDQASFRIALRGETGGAMNTYVDHLRVTKATLAARADGKACTSGADCDSGICRQSPHGALYCAPTGATCVDGHRQGVASGATVCSGPDRATCNAGGTWSVTSCANDCGAYVGVHACEVSGTSPACASCEESCDPFFDTGCDPNAYCVLVFIFPECRLKKNDGQACDSNRMCLSGNCAPAPGGARYCEPAGTPCANPDGSPASLGAVTCHNNDRAVCQSGGWSITDCYTNCGFYADVDQCTAGVCATCATSCTGNQDCKAGILCQGNVCVGNLPLGSTCQLGTQCGSNQCVDGRCCQDVCNAPCHRCDLDSTGVCRPIGTGLDPDEECAGVGLCGGTCNGAGGCQFPGGQVVCDACARCDGRGACASYLPAGTDPADECPACQVCPGGPGGCVPAAAGLDPMQDCAETPAASCGLDGACDGQGQCRPWTAGTPCAPSSCASGVEQIEDTCDGAGRCVERGSRSCGFYRCADATRCASACASHADCVPEGFCALGGACLGDLGPGASCEGVVLPGQVAGAACVSGYCFPDNFDGQGAFCASGAGVCVHDGVEFPAGDALCSGDDFFRVCLGGAQGWGPEIACAAGLCDAGGGPGSGYRQAGTCLSGPGGGCSTGCTSCEPYRAESAFSCLAGCSQPDHCWPGYECRAGSCQVPEGIGQACATQADCRAGVCVDGRCCTEACTGLCRACNLPGREGFCTFAGAGSDPDEDCPSQPAASCGTSGTCDGEGACAFWPAGQTCAPAGCEGVVLLGVSACDGRGACTPGSQTDCRPGRCQGLACRQDCQEHAGCDPAGFCGLQGLCLPDLADGQSCEGVVWPGLAPHPACQSGRCAPDELAGGALCASGVDTCVGLGQIYQPGYRLCDGAQGFWICLGGEHGWSAFEACPGPGVCDAGGGLGSGVRPEAVCASGPLGGCRAACQSCFPYRASQPGVCLALCSGDADCWPGLSCDTSVCVPGDGLGVDCQLDAECPSGFCRDGVCCNLDCAGPCELCHDPLARGVCLHAQAGTDPGDDCEPEAAACGRTGLCDEEGVCGLQPAGTTCAPAACLGGVLSSASFCDGRGQCAPGLEHACPSGACLGDACAPASPDGGDGGDGGDQGDLPPWAEAGSVAPVRPGTPVTLDGSRSRDPEGAELVYVWEQSSGPESVELAGATTPRPSFTPRLEGVYSFQLVVSDGAQSSRPAYVDVRVVDGQAGCACGAGEEPLGLGLLLLAVGLGLVRRRRRA
jgi:hypothetical protein